VKIEYRSDLESVSIKPRTARHAPTGAHVAGSRRPGARPPGTAWALLVCAVAALLPLPLGAQEERIESPFEWIERGLRLGLFGGYRFADRGNLDHGPGSTVAGGARFRIRVSSPLSLELGASYQPAERWVIDPSLETGPAPVDTVKVGYLMASAGIQVGLTGARTWNGIHPFLTLGGALNFGIDEERSDVFVDPDQTDLRFDLGTSPAFYLGAGFEVFPSERVGVAIEARDYLTRLKAPDGWFTEEILTTIRDAGAEAPKEGQWTHNLELSLTLYFYF
jgi:hypothetical protein